MQELNLGPKPLVLIILDGWGYRAETKANAIAMARKPTYDRLLREYPNTLIQTSGPFVGLPEGQMGNSEVGHMNMGSGRIVYQELTRINKSIKDGDFFDVHSEHNMWRAGARVTFPGWRAQLAAGATATDDSAERTIMTPGGEGNFQFWTTRWELQYARFNLGLRPIADLDVALSAIVRRLQYDARDQDPTSGGDESIAYESTSVSTSVQAIYALSHRFSVGVNGILEVHRREGTGEDSATRTLPRFGLFTGFWF